jgi:hypothetical protein
MDSKQFDELVARLASTASRRNAVKGVLGGTLASVGVTSVVSAKKKGKASAKKKSKASAEKKGGGGGKKACKGQPKQIICHTSKKHPEGRTIEVGACAAEKHLKKHYGDEPGPC